MDHDSRHMGIATCAGLSVNMRNCQSEVGVRDVG
jgi:hypothetical protein